MKINDDEGLMVFTVAIPGKEDVAFTLDVEQTCDELRLMYTETCGTDQSEAKVLAWYAKAQEYFSKVSGHQLTRNTTRRLEAAIYERRDQLRKKPAASEMSTEPAVSTASTSGISPEASK